MSEYNEKIGRINEEVYGDDSEVKVVKKEKGLFEKTKSSKIVITEENKRLLMD